MSEARQGRLVAKLVDEVVRQVMLKQPTVGMSVAEQQLIERSVRQQMFEGRPLTQKDVGALVRRVVESRPPQQPPAESAAGERDSVRSSASSAQRSLPPLVGRAQTPSASPGHSGAGSRPASSCSGRSSASAASHQTSQSRGSVAQMSNASTRTGGRVSIIRQRDHEVIRQLVNMCEANPYREPAKSEKLRTKASDDPWLKKALSDKALAEEAAVEARRRQLAEQAKLREALAEQIRVRSEVVAAERESDVKEHEARVAAAEESLRADRATQQERRRKRELERQALASEQRGTVARKREAAAEERVVDRQDAQREQKDAEVQLSQEREHRKRQIASLKDMLVSEMEKKKRENHEQHLKQLEYEYELLRDMGQQLDAERKRMEEARAARVAAARAAQEVTRQLATERARQQAEEKQRLDNATIAGDRDFNDKEKRDARSRREKTIETQEFLKRQIREKQLATHLARDADAEFVNQAHLDEVEAKEQLLEDAHLKREAQRQLRAFLDLQRRARAARAGDEVEVSIARSRATPW